MTKALFYSAAASVAMAGAALAQDSFGGPQQPPPQQSDQQWGQQPPPANGPNNGGWGQQPPANNPANNGGWGQQPPANNGGGANLDQLMQMERQDFGVQPTNQLHSGAMHGPTPASIPGGQLITTKGLVSLVQGKQAPYLLFDVLGGPQTLPGAIPAVVLAQPGSFNDQVSQQFGQNLQQATGGRKDVPLIFYCLSTQCWMSYNASLRAINLGYTNVLWYRGGIEAWQQAGLQTQPAQQFGPPQQQQNQQYPQQAPQQQYPQQQGGWPNQ